MKSDLLDIPEPTYPQLLRGLVELKSHSTKDNQLSLNIAPGVDSDSLFSDSVERIAIIGKDTGTRYAEVPLAITPIPKLFHRPRIVSLRGSPTSPTIVVRSGVAIGDEKLLRKILSDGRIRISHDSGTVIEGSYRSTKNGNRVASLEFEIPQEKLQVLAEVMDGNKPTYRAQVLGSADDSVLEFQVRLPSSPE